MIGNECLHIVCKILIGAKVRTDGVNAFLQARRLHKRLDLLRLTRRLIDKLHLQILHGRSMRRAELSCPRVLCAVDIHFVRQRIHRR